MTRLAAALSLLFALLLASPPAWALSQPPAIPNWTETWVTPTPGGDDPFEVEFTFDEDSIYDLAFGTPTLDVSEGSMDDVSGLFLDLHLPNFVDPLLKKKIIVVFEGEVGDSEKVPSVLSIVAWDTPYFDPTADPVELEARRLAAAPHSAQPGFFMEFWEIVPNPDHELISIFLPDDFELESFHVLTSSFGRVLGGQTVPEPAGTVLVLIGLAGLLRAGRRQG